MIKRVFKNLSVFTGAVPGASTQLERDGYAVVTDVFDATTVGELRAEIDGVFASAEPERNRSDAVEFRYEMLNRSAACQAALAHPKILEAIEPLLGDDCHVIAKDCTCADGPTAVVPGSHRSGRLAPFDQLWNDELSYDGRPPAVLTARAGDVAFFVSDCWHRGLPAAGGSGRDFLQVHYARRDIAQRVRTTAVANQLSVDAIARAQSDREKTLVGLHDPMFYDG